MDKGTKVQLIQMQSLMERMEKHYTKDEANAHVNFKLVKEGLGEVDNHTVTGDRFENYIGRIKKGWQVHQSCHPAQSYQANIYEQYVCREHCQS